MELCEIRSQIDEIDDKLVNLFCRRMALCAQVAAYKKDHGLPVFVPEREQAKLEDVAAKAGDEMETYTRELYQKLFSLSRNYQETLL